MSFPLINQYIIVYNIMNCPNTNNQRETMYKQIDYIYVMHYTPVSERKIDFNTLLWGFSIHESLKKYSV